MVDMLGVVVVLGSGIVAGVLFAVALSVLPALWAMPPDRYVYAHQLIGKNWDPTMPVVVLSTVAANAVLAFTIGDGMAWLAACGAVLLTGVSVVSHFCNVPINRKVKTLDPESVPPDWQDPRPLWRKFHTLRTVLALLALLANAVAVTVD